VKHALTYCEENWIDEIMVFVDPNAMGFYEKIGGTFFEKSPSSIAGRDIPVYVFKIA